MFPSYRFVSLFRTLGAAGIPQCSLAIQAFTNARAACYPAISAIEQNSDTRCKPNQMKVAASTKLATSFPKTQKIGFVSPEVVSAATLKFDSICFDKVCFSYPSRPDALVLGGLSFSLKSGQTVGVVGPSGSGVRQNCALHCFFEDWFC